VKDPRNEEDLLPLHVSKHRLTSQADILLQNARGSISKPETTRRLAFASALMTAGALLGADEARAVDGSTSSSDGADASVLTWKINPINKRSGVTLFDAEKSGYNVQFITYLACFLLSFDVACQRWWFALDLPRSGSAEQINEIRLDQFGAFAASVEVGLQEFEGGDGPKNLMKSLMERYSPDVGPKSDSDSEQKKQKRRAIKEARRQIALLFGLMTDNQPVKEITALLAAIDNGSITSVKMITDPVIQLRGFAPGDEPPLVEFPAPEAGDSFDRATGRAILEPTGSILRIEIVDPGSGYETPPLVSVTPPQREGGSAATIKVKISSNGPNKGSIESVELLDPGSGYAKDEALEMKVPAPEDENGQAAVLRPVPELRVDRIQVVYRGSGYAVEKPLKIYINATIEGKAEKPVVAGMAYPEAEKSSYTGIRRDGDIKQVLEFEDKLDKQYDLRDKQILSGSDSGAASNIPLIPLWGGKATSSKLLRLIPNGVGLKYDSQLKRYTLDVDSGSKDSPTWLQQSSTRPLDPQFGPRGRSPLERDMKLGLGTYLRFSASGAVCASGVHLALTPLDVVKTKVQTNPTKYPSVGASFKRVFAEEGLSTFFTGWVPTFLGNFLNGAVLYGTTEVVRRYLIEVAGTEATTLEVPIILAAAATASFMGAFLICPFEAVRIRSVAQPDFAPNFPGVVTRIYEEEGLVKGFLDAIPVFLLRNVPYAMMKFTVFDLSTERLNEAFPAANEDLKLSLLITLVGGILGGIAAAVVSNPADATISEMKKAKSDIGPRDALAVMLDREGIASLFKGLQLRMVFYSMVASLQFVVYDSVRFALGIGPDDLKLYLDVLGGALNAQGGPL